MTNNELLKQPFNIIRELLEWRTAAGDIIPLEDMETIHIKNIIVMLDGKQKAYDNLDLGDYEYAGHTAREWMNALRRELEFRTNPKIDSEKLSTVTL